MGRPGIGYDDVARVADKLLADGQRVNIESIRHGLGDTGSNGTIHKHFRAWQEKRPVTTPTADSIPAEVIQVIAGAIDRKRSEAISKVETQLGESQADAMRLADEVELLEGENESLRLQHAEDIAIHARLSGCIAEMEKQLSGANAGHANIVQRLQDCLSSEREAAEMARTELAKAQLRLEALPRMEQDLLASREGAALLHERAHQAERELTAAQTGLVSAKYVADECRQAAKEFAERLQAEQVRNAEHVDKIAELREQLASANTLVTADLEHMKELRSIYESSLEKALGESKANNGPKGKTVTTAK